MKAPFVPIERNQGTSNCGVSRYGLEGGVAGSTKGMGGSTRWTATSGIVSSASEASAVRGSAAPGEEALTSSGGEGSGWVGLVNWLAARRSGAVVTDREGKTNRGGGGWTGANRIGTGPTTGRYPRRGESPSPSAGMTKRANPAAIVHGCHEPLPRTVTARPTIPDRAFRISPRFVKKSTLSPSYRISEEVVPAGYPLHRPLAATGRARRPSLPFEQSSTRKACHGRSKHRQLPQQLENPDQGQTGFRSSARQPILSPL